MEALKPLLNGVSILGLLFTLIVMFALKGDLILKEPAIVLEMAIPMTLFFSIMFFTVLVVGWRMRFPYRDAVAVAFNATGRDFEIAIAIAITAFSPTVALATVVGPLIEVPVMLFFVWSAMRLAPRMFGVQALPVVAGGVSVTTQLPVVAQPRLDLPAPDVADAAAVAALLADRTRAAILRMLADGPHCVCEMAAALGERENNVSNHLARLRDAGLVRAVRHEANARFLYYERDEAARRGRAAALDEVLR